MRNRAIHIEARPLRVRLKTTFRHAAATRDTGESVWVQATRDSTKGFGEGCPRTYVAGDDVESSIKWIEENFLDGNLHFETVTDLRQWVDRHCKVIDKYPSAWCAVEMAILDLLSREQSCSIEALLGLKNHERFGRYSAVLGDDNKEKFKIIANQYFLHSLSDFKIKLNGDLEIDNEKLRIIELLSNHYHSNKLRIRVDANNLWKNRCDDAIMYLKALNGQIFAVEEPVGARDVRDISRITISTALPIILDESLCTLNDLSLYKDLPRKYIANIKVSKMGGLIRALGLIEELKVLGWPIIIGCHVGETSLLTRAAMVAAAAAGENLLAQEGAFGDYLVEREPVAPMLKFGREGLLNLSLPYYVTTAQSVDIIPADNWDIGFGMQGRMPIVADDGSPKLDTREKSDGYDYV